MKHPGFCVSNLVLALCAALFLAGNARGADVSAQAVLSEAQTSVGQPVELQITISGAQKAEPPTIAVDGLQVSHAGQQSSRVMSFDGSGFKNTVTTTHVFMVTPERAGEFTIPALKIAAGGGRVVTTNPLTLRVAAGPGNRAAQGGAAAGADEGLAFAELIVPVEEAYVGEVIPVELRFYFSNSARFRSNGAPTLGGDGFTAKKFPEARKDEVTRGGKPYTMVTFKSAITPVKAGDFSLGPAELAVTAQLPEQRRRGRPHLNDLFDDPFFQNPMFGGYREQAMTVRSEPLKLKVKPLPVAGRPAGFGSAVGRYSMSVEASPLKASVGEPITAQVKIAGRGDFDRVDGPKLADESGWRVYPPSSDFQADDVLGISGTKTFVMSLIPNEEKSELGEIEFSYFDPVAEKYVTLASNKTPITVTGTPAATPTPAAATAGTKTAAAEVTPSGAVDIHYIRTDAADWGQSFQPLYQRPVFWAAQSAPLAALIALVGFGFVRQLRQDTPARRAAELRRARAETLAALKSSESESGQFYDAAVRWVQLDTALTTGRAPETIDADDAASHAPDALREGVQAIFAARAELRYAHAGRPGGVAPNDRAAVLETISELEAGRA